MDCYRSQCTALWSSADILHCSFVADDDRLYRCRNPSRISSASQVGREARVVICRQWWVGRRYSPQCRDSPRFRWRRAGCSAGSAERPGEIVVVTSGTRSTATAVDGRPVRCTWIRQRDRQPSCRLSPSTGKIFVSYTLGLTSISVWSRSDRREYVAITCDQVQAWSRSLGWVGSGLRHLLYKLGLTGHLETGGEDGRCRTNSSKLCIVGGDQGVPECTVPRWVVAGKTNSLCII